MPGVEERICAGAGTFVPAGLAGAELAMLVTRGFAGADEATAAAGTSAGSLFLLIGFSSTGGR
jgi:hypothetical protein